MSLPQPAGEAGTPVNLGNRAALERRHPAPVRLRTLLCAAALLGIACTPSTAEPDDGWISQVRDAIGRETENKDIPAFALVVVGRDGAMVEFAHGVRRHGGADAVTPRTLFRTGSVGKTITDLAIMLAVEEGKIDLDEDVGTYLRDFHPENPFGEPITLRQLMTHRAGLVREPPVGSYFDDRHPSLQSTVASLNGTTLLWPPGTRTKYSNAGLAVAGRVLELVYDAPFSDVVTRLVFRPAGMTSARVGYRDEIADNLARGIMWFPDGSTWEAPIFDLGMSPAGDLYASIRDMAALIVTLLRRDGRLIRTEALEEMWSPQFSPPRDDWHLEVGLGFSLNGKFEGRHKMARNGGAVYGYATELALLPDEDLGVYAVATRDMSNGTVQAIAHYALSAVLAARRGEPPHPYEMTSTPFADLPGKLSQCSTTSDDPNLRRFLGRYGADHNPLIICETNGQLHARIEWFFLYPLSRVADGVYGFPSWSLYGHEQLRFVGADGRIARVELGYGPAGIRFPRVPE